MFYNELRHRFKKYNFQLAEEKTRILEFGRFAQENIDKRRAAGKTTQKHPETFAFLGFRFYCSKNHKGKFCPKVKSDGKRVTTKLKKAKDWLVKNRNKGTKAAVKHFNRVLEGYYNPKYGILLNLVRALERLERLSKGSDGHKNDLI